MLGTLLKYAIGTTFRWGDAIADAHSEQFRQPPDVFVICYQSADHRRVPGLLKQDGPAIRQTHKSEHLDIGVERQTVRAHFPVSGKMRFNKGIFFSHREQSGVSASATDDGRIQQRDDLFEAVRCAVCSCWFSRLQEGSFFAPSWDSWSGWPQSDAEAGTLSITDAPNVSTWMTQRHEATTLAAVGGGPATTWVDRSSDPPRWTHCCEDP